MADLKLDHNFCVDFREEISRHGISGVITELLDSKSVNVPNKKKYLARECGKKGSFKAQLENAFSTLITSQPHKKAALKGLKDEIFLLIPAKKYVVASFAKCSWLFLIRNPKSFFICLL